MNKYYIYNKIFKIACSKYVSKALLRYMIGKYIVDSVFFIHNSYNILC